MVWVKQKHCSTAGTVRGRTNDGTIRKLKRITCDELRLSGHQPQSANNVPESSGSSSPVLGSGRRRSSFDGDSLPSYVAVNPFLFKTIIESSWHTLTRIYVFRCSLFRFTEKDISGLAALKNLILLSICRVTDAHAVNDTSLLPVVAKGTVEKLVLDRMMVTDRLLIEIGHKCKKLSFLSVWGCAGITETGVAEVAKASAGDDGIKIICRQTQFDCMRFLRELPRFRLSTSGRALELPQKKISIHFV